MWDYYTISGFYKTFETIRKAYDESLQSCLEEIKILNKNGNNITIDDFIKKKQPFENNELYGKFIGGSFCFLNKSNCIFELPPENTNIHIIALTHMDNETHYLVKSNVAKYYFGDDDWEKIKSEK